MICILQNTSSSYWKHIEEFERDKCSGCKKRLPKEAVAKAVVANDGSWWYTCPECNERIKSRYKDGVIVHDFNKLENAKHPILIGDSGIWKEYNVHKYATLDDMRRSATLTKITPPIGENAKKLAVILGKLYSSFEVSDNIFEMALRYIYPASYVTNNLRNINKLWVDTRKLFPNKYSLVYKYGGKIERAVVIEDINNTKVIWTDIQNL
jgi:hypothetical protein